MKRTNKSRARPKTVTRPVKDLAPKNERDIKAGRDPADGLPTGKR